MEFSKIHKYTLLISFIFSMPLTEAQVLHNKSGGICFRFDDNLPLDQLAHVTAVFNKHKVKYCLSLNLDALPDNPDYVPFLQKLDRDGFELMDHCPNHGTSVFWTDALAIYKQHRGVDHLNVTSNMVCLKYESLDKNKFQSRGFVKATKDLVISKTNGEFKNLANNIHYLYFPSLKKMANPFLVANINSSDPDTMRLRNFWGEMLDLEKMDRLEYYIVNSSDVHMTFEARSALASESIRLFRKYNLQRPLTWIQPGGKTPQFTPSEIKETFGNRFHYTSAGSNGGLQCYNDASRDARFAMQWGDFSGGVNVSSSDKNQIADQIAKHYFLIGGSHFWDVPISWDLYLSRLDSILSWCQQMKIPVKTYRQWAKSVYDTPQNPYTNIFPCLSIDRDENKIPDGYDLKNAKLDTTDGPIKNAYSLVARKKGKICEIKALAGIEKGENEFFIWTKGYPGNFITVTIHFQEDQNSVVYKFPAENNKWTRYSLKESFTERKSLSMPENYSYAHFEIACSDYKGGYVKIGGIKLNKKLSDPLYIMSKPDTLVSLNTKYEYQVNTAQYNLTDSLAYELINCPSWLTIDSHGLVSGIPVPFDGILPIIIQVKDQSGNTVKQSYSLQSKNRVYSLNAFIEWIIHFIVSYII